MVMDMGLYHSLAMFFFGYFVCLLPKSEDGEHWIVLPVVVVICFVAALIFPITITALSVVIYYERKRRIKDKTMAEKMGFCTGTHGGANNKCDSCMHNIENHPDNIKYNPEDHYRIDELACRLRRPYWSQWKAK